MAGSDYRSGLQVLIMRGVMKKIILFFAVFFLFSLLAAEEISAENKETQELSENTTTCPCNEFKNYNKTKKFYFALVPTFELLWTISAGMDFDLLLKHTEKGHNIYMGLSFTPGYSFFQYGFFNVFELPFQVNAAFDFKQNNCVVDYLSLRISGGINLIFGQPETSNYSDDARRYGGLSRIVPAAVINLDLIFVNNMIFRVGLDMASETSSFYGGWMPFPMFGLGYRF